MPTFHQDCEWCRPEQVLSASENEYYRVKFCATHHPDRVKQLEAQLALAREALKKYGTHQFDTFGRHYLPCSCGLDTALTALTPPKAP